VDIDPVELTVQRSMPASTGADLSLRLRGVAALAGRVKASLAVSGGVQTALDVIKVTMTGAHVVHIASALEQHGPGHLRVLRAGIESWMKENEWASLGEMRGNMAFDRVPDPAAFEREQFRILQ
jgi:dihydroorotate dehydrogenase (fumarate)